MTDGDEKAMTKQREKPTEITEETRVPVRFVWGGMLIAATVVGLFSSIKYDLSEIKRVSRTHSTLDWTLEDQKAWTRKLEKENPTLKVPEVMQVPAPDHAKVASAAQ